jgi:ribosomal protein L37AE/L43A
MKSYKPHCAHCNTEYSTDRWKLGYKHCMPCGEKLAKDTRHTIVPMAKSNYVVVTDKELLKGLNKYANS